ncbi:ATP-binding protein [Sorangium sp. So ce1099]|uniref:ATP-binding protein n=1 Tax=Sorangium sp. So ce1099 TaxID=3133331 RepID=UPI003F6372F9
MTERLNPQSFDVAAIIQAAQAVASENLLPRVIDRLLRISVANAGAQRAALLLCHDQKLLLDATIRIDPDVVEVDILRPVEECPDLPQTILNYVVRTRQVVVLGDAPSDACFGRDLAIARLKPRSILCLPLLYRGAVTGVLHLEHATVPDVFHPTRVKVLEWLAAQAAIAVENARLLGALEAASAEVRRANEKLELAVIERTRELADAQARLIALEKEATEVQMAGGFAHEMRNILTGAKTFLAKIQGVDEERRSLCAANNDMLKELYLLTRDHLPEGTRREAATLVRRINTNGEVMHAALSDIGELLDRALASTRVILRYARLGRERRGSRPVRLRPLVESILRELEGDFAQHGIVAEIQIDPESMLDGDEVHLDSMLRNLVLNARDALCENGEPTERKIRVALVEDEQSTTVYVSDTGIGIPPDVRARMFEPFFSTKPETGTGLGLPVVRKLASIYGGKIEVDSEPGRRTTIGIVLPKAEHRDPACAEPTREPPPSPSDLLRGSA